MLRTTVSAENFRPLSYEVVNRLNEGNQRGKLGRVDVSGYKLYANGIWFPSKVVVSTAAFHIEYSLVKADFNDAVDPAELLLPPLSSIADLRFGSAVEPIRYQPKDGQIPTDNEVRKMMGMSVERATELSNAIPKQARPTEKPGNSTAAVPLLGLLFVGLGGTLWVRAKKME